MLHYFVVFLLICVIKVIVYIKDDLPVYKV